MPLIQGTNGRFRAAVDNERVPDEKRCTFRNHISIRCNRWRAHSTLYCRQHLELNERLNNRKKSVDMPHFYQRYVTKTLGEVLEEALSVNPAEQIQVFSELALMRDLAGQAVAMYGVARDLYTNAVANNADEKERARLSSVVFAAGQLMRDQLSEVVKLCDTAHKITSNPKDKVSIMQLNFFVEQVTRCVYESFGDDPRVMDFNDRLQKQVRLPDVNGSNNGTGPNGTTLTPDMDVLAMDNTVPAVNEVIDIEKLQ